MLPASQAEIHQQWLACGIQHHILRLHIAMNDSLAMGIGQRPRQIADDLGNATILPGQCAQMIVERLSFDIRHGDEIAIAVASGVIDGDDVGMIEICGGLCFTFKPFQDLRILDQLRLQHLDRYRAIQSRIEGFIDDAK